MPETADRSHEEWLANREERRHDDEDTQPLDRWDRLFEDRD